MRSVFFALLIIVNVIPSYGQHAKRFTSSFLGSVVLSEVDDKYNPSVYSLEMPEPDGDAEQKILRNLKEQIARDFPHKSSPQSASKTTSLVDAPVVTISFVADSFPGIPPDNSSAVSNGQKAVTVLNSNIAIHDATTGAYLQRKSLKTFSTAVGLNGTSDYRYDPKVVYDRDADKFICVMLSGTDVYNHIVLAFSQTNDPLGRWNFYEFYGDYTGDTTWFDYPAISVTKNEFFLTGNKLQFNSTWQAGFKQTIIYQIRKQDGYDSTTLNYQIWDSIMYNNKPLRCLYPLNTGDTLLGPSQYFLSNRNFAITNDTVFLVKVPDTIGSTSNVLTVTPVVSTTASYGAPPNGRMPDTAHVLATNDGRVLGGFIKGNQLQFVSESLNPVNGSSAVYHGIIENFSTAPVMHAQLFSIDTLDFGYPNISSGGGPGEAIISFEYTGPRTFPGLGAILYDGSNYSDMTIIRKGDSSIYITSFPNREQRWGDYSGSQPDFGTPGAVWVDGIYGRKDRKYGNMMARLYNPYHVATPKINKPEPAATKVYPNPSFKYVSFEFNVSKDQVFSFVIYDMQGRVVDKIMDKYCQDGKNIIHFDIAPLAPGTYLLKALGANGESIAIHTFVRQ